MSAALVAWAASSGLGALALGLAAWTVDRLLGGRARALAAGLWWACLVRLVLPGDLGSPVGVSFELPAAGSDGATPDALGRAVEFGPVAVDSIAAVGASATWTAALRTSLADALADHVTADMLVLVWVVGALAFAALAATRVLAERRRWHRTAGRAPRAATRRVAERVARAAGLRRTPELRLHDGPAACVGVLAPWIALPRELDRADRRRDLEAVLSHECAHLWRRDGLRRAVVLALQCAFWFHPVVWLAGRRLDALAELDCDRRAAAVARGGAAVCRRALLAEARSWLPREALLARTFAPPRSLLLERLRALDAGHRPRRAAAPLAFGLALACVGPAAVLPVLDDFVVPPVDELEGCMQKRFAVYAALAAAQETEPVPSR